MRAQDGGPTRAAAIRGGGESGSATISATRGV